MCLKGVKFHENYGISRSTDGLQTALEFEINRYKNILNIFQILKYAAVNLVFKPSYFYSILIKYINNTQS